MTSIRKAIYAYCFSVVLFLVTICVFLAILFSERANESLYLVCAALMIICGICYYFSNKRITCEGGYTYVQAYLFYRECVKNGVCANFELLCDRDLDVILELSKSHDYCDGFNSDQVKNMFFHGYEVSKII